jgi:hypothetical protein
MAKAKKTRGKTKTKRGARKGAAKGARRRTAARGRSAGASGAAKRVAELEAENSRLREEIASLRADLANRADQGAQGDGEQTPLGI